MAPCTSSGDRSPEWHKSHKWRCSFTFDPDNLFDRPNISPKSSETTFSDIFVE
jgi:hypothetical protein